MIFAEMSCQQIKEHLDRLQNGPDLERACRQLSTDKRITVRKIVAKQKKILIGLEQEKKRLAALFSFEKEIWQQGLSSIAGIDEAGRGPLAGPVVAAAVVLSPETIILGLNDSKKVREPDRRRMAQEIKIKALAWSIGVVDAQTIDRINILEATWLAMELALKTLSIDPKYVFIDGLAHPRINLAQKALINGDSRSASIAAASILAKVHRDYLMETYDEIYPNYYFRQHKGYGTADHLQALDIYGPCFIHRKTFKPVNQRLGGH